MGTFKIRSFTPICKAVCLGLILASWIHAKAVFTELQYNPHWYRTYDSASDIIPDKGQLLFNWIFADSQAHPDSFYVGIDTLWSLPQDVGSDTGSDWDLQICPDGICLNGLKAGVHGANAPYYFDTTFKAEHHFQFFPAIDSVTYEFVSPPKSIFGGMMFCRSRTTGAADTVFGFGAWKMAWDPDYLPPLRPVAGYLPMKSDFVISNDTVRYLKGAAGIHGGRAPYQRPGVSRLGISVSRDEIRLEFIGIPFRKSVAFFTVDGKGLGIEKALPENQSNLVIPKNILESKFHSQKMLFVQVRWNQGEELSRIVPIILP